MGCPAYSCSLLPLCALFRGRRLLRYLDEWRDLLFLNTPDTKPGFNTMVADDEAALWMWFSPPEGSTQSEWLIVEASAGNAVAGVTSGTVVASGC